jgi:hypothetical protein
MHAGRIRKNNRRRLRVSGGTESQNSQLGSILGRPTDVEEPVKLENAHEVEDINKDGVGVPVRKRIDFEELGDWSERKSSFGESVAVAAIFVFVAYLIHVLGADIGAF